jgi:hypothetical protein
LLAVIDALGNETLSLFANDENGNQTAVTDTLGPPPPLSTAPAAAACS